MAARRSAALKAFALALSPDQPLVAETPTPAFAASNPALPAAPAAPAMPARGLQELLDASITDPVAFASPERRWSARRMLAFAFAASGLLWCGIGAGVYLFIHRA